MAAGDMAKLSSTPFISVVTGIATAPIAMVVVKVYVEEALNTRQNPQNEPK
jgi:hypothetical protein